jgi:hypothetical protein
VSVAELEAETARLTTMIVARWPRSWCELSHVAGPWPWRICFGGFERGTRLIQGRDPADAFAKARQWLEGGAVSWPPPGPEAA